MIPASCAQLGRWEERVSATDWDSVRADLDAYGCGLTGPLLTPDEAAQIAALYDDDSRFRSTINMGRHRFGEGEYRYFAEPFPEAVTGLKRALYPRLLPMASTAGTVPEPGGRTYTLLGADRRLYRSAAPGRFGGHRKSRIYGRLDCPAALRAIVGGGYAAHRVFFADERTAVAAGYRPCAVCLPGAYAAWKAR